MKGVVIMGTEINWADFDSKVDLDALRTLANKQNNTGSFEKVKYGEYIVEMSCLLLTKSKSGRPMMKAIFKIVEGEMSDKCIYMYQVLQTSLQIDICCSFLKSLKTNQKIIFDSYSQFSDLLKSIYLEAKNKIEFKLDYGCNAKGYDTFRIIEVYDV